MGKYGPTLNYMGINSYYKTITLLDKSKLVKRCTSDPIQAFPTKVIE